MSTGIEWTDETWNPVTGCTKVSEGCDHCYAERITNRFGGAGAFDKVVLHPERLEQPLRWRKPRRVFVNSMSDLFHDAIPDELIVQAFAVMAVTGEHTYQILTKRPGRMASLLQRMDADEQFGTPRNRAMELVAERAAAGCRPEFPLPNVWLGVSVENQKWANVRVPQLLETPAVIRFLSCEPLLGPLDIDAWLNEGEDIEDDAVIDWVIAGGESGPGARPMALAWARSIRDQCVEAQVPFFLKQLGGHPNKRGHDAAVLDGQRWIQFPEARA